MITIRAAHFAATILVVGIVVFVVFIAEPAFRDTAAGPNIAATLRRRLAPIAWISLVVAVASGAAWLVLVAAAMSSQPVAAVFSGGVLWTVLGETGFGHDWLVRALLAAALAAVLPFLFSPRTSRAPFVTFAAPILAAAFAGSLVWAGHAAGGLGTEATLHPAADFLHLVAASAWLGGLVPLALVLAAAGGDAASLAAARSATLRFSTLGIAAVATLLVTGLVNGFYLVGSIEALVGTSYGRLLLVKIALFAGMVVFAAVNRLWMTPLLVRDAGGAGGAANARRALCRNAAIEAAAGAAIIAIVAVLGTLPPASHAQHHPAYGAIPADASFQHIHSERGMADITIEPGRVGPARATIRLWTEDFEPLAAKAVTLTLAAPAAASAPVTRGASQAADGSWRVDAIELSQPGNWIVTVNAELGTAAPLVLEARIVIEAK
jgi:putative copper resistance protein D